MVQLGAPRGAVRFDICRSDPIWVHGHDTRDHHTEANKWGHTRRTLRPTQLLARALLTIDLTTGVMLVGTSVVLGCAF